jgi:hypothetical protein
MPNFQHAPGERTGYALTLQNQNTLILQDGNTAKMTFNLSPELAGSFATGSDTVFSL